MKKIKDENIDKKYFDAKELIKCESYLPLFTRFLVKKQYNYVKSVDNNGIKIITKYPFKPVSTL